MNVIIFGINQDTIKQELETLIFRHLHYANVIPVGSKQHLSEIFSQPLNQIDVLVSFIGTAKDINVLHALYPALNHIKLILVLHCCSTEMIQSGLRLLPSYVSYFDNDLIDIISVLKKIKEKKNGRHDSWTNLSA